MRSGEVGSEACCGSRTASGSYRQKTDGCDGRDDDDEDEAAPAAAAAAATATTYSTSAERTDGRTASANNVIVLTTVQASTAFRP